MPQTKNQTVEHKIITIVREMLGNETASLETDVIKDLCADSLDITDLIMELEDEFNMSIPDEDAMDLYPVGRPAPISKAVAYIQRRLAKQKEKEYLEIRNSNF